MEFESDSPNMHFIQLTTTDQPITHFMLLIVKWFSTDLLKSWQE